MGRCGAEDRFGQSGQGMRKLIVRARALVNAVANRVPAPVADQIFPGRRREFREAGTTSRPDGVVRLLIGPLNSAGQATAWARAAHAPPSVAASSFMYRGAEDIFSFDVDHAVTTQCFVRNSRWRRAQRKAVVRNFTHVIVESGRHMFGVEGSALTQIRGMQHEGVRVGLLWHGSDIRLPSGHVAIERDSPFRGGEYVDTNALEQITRSNQQLSRDAGLPIFVSTPDLLHFVPTATWLPVVVDFDTWASAGAVPALSGSHVPVVVHAPTRVGLKGSDKIVDVLVQLQDEGMIEYREVHGVPAREMPAVYGSADIVLDQFRVGAYGVAACQAMAAGRLVVSHVADPVRAHVLKESDHDLPIVQARWNEIDTIIRQIVANRSWYAAQALRGPGFVQTVHDGRRSAELLQSFLRT